MYLRGRDTKKIVLANFIYFGSPQRSPWLLLFLSGSVNYLTDLWRWRKKDTKIQLGQSENNSLCPFPPASCGECCGFTQLRNSVNSPRKLLKRKLINPCLGFPAGGQELSCHSS